MGGSRWSRMRATQELVEEHRVIERVLTALSRWLGDAERTGTIPAAFLRNLTAFSQGFVDRCHHAKEEGCLFPCLAHKGSPRESELIGVMLQEHEMGRRLVRQIALQLDRHEAGAASAADVLSPCRAYLELLQQHILKENHALFPMGEQIMVPADDEQTSRCYEDREGDAGHEEHSRLLRLAEAMAAGI